MAIDFGIVHLERSDPPLTLIVHESMEPVRLSGILFGLCNTSNELPCTRTNSPAARSWAERLAAYLSGREDDFRDIPLDFGGFTDFRKLVTETARSIPYGKTVSYGELAQMSGKSKAVRAVGTVMRRNPWPIVVPCHRVITSGRSVGGYCGAISGKWVRLKERLLVLEGISPDVLIDENRRKRNRTPAGMLVA